MFEQFQHYLDISGWFQSFLDYQCISNIPECLKISRCLTFFGRFQNWVWATLYQAWHRPHSLLPTGSHSQWQGRNVTCVCIMPTYCSYALSADTTITIILSKLNAYQLLVFSNNLPHTSFCILCREEKNDQKKVSTLWKAIICVYYFLFFHFQSQPHFQALCFLCIKIYLFLSVLWFHSKFGSKTEHSYFLITMCLLFVFVGRLSNNKNNNYLLIKKTKTLGASLWILLVYK